MVTSIKRCATVATSDLLVLRGMKKKKAIKLSQGQRQRLQFIESRLIWEGSFRRSDVCEAFELTLNHLTREITSYRKAFKDNLVYDPETRSWRAGSRFVPAYASGGADEYLASLQAYALSGDRMVMATTGPPLPAQGLPGVAGKVEAATLKEVIGAIRRSGALSVRYQSFSEGDPAERILWPHAMVYALQRWHLRAYDSRRQTFGDFVLARILKARPSSAAADETPPATADEGWQKAVTLDIVPTATLSPSQRAVVAREYGMRRSAGTSVWKATMRRCLAPYFLTEHRLDLPTDAAPHRRIALLDPADASRYAFVDD